MSYFTTTHFNQEIPLDTSNRGFFSPREHPTTYYSLVLKSNDSHSRQLAYVNGDPHNPYNFDIDLTENNRGNVSGSAYQCNRIQLEDITVPLPNTKGWSVERSPILNPVVKEEFLDKPAHEVAISDANPHNFLTKFGYMTHEQFSTTHEELTELRIEVNSPNFEMIGTTMNFDQRLKPIATSKTFDRHDTGMVSEFSHLKNLDTLIFDKSLYFNSRGGQHSNYALYPPPQPNKALLYSRGKVYDEFQTTLTGPLVNPNNVTTAYNKKSLLMSTPKLCRIKYGELNNMRIRIYPNSSKHTYDQHLPDLPVGQETTLYTIFYKIQELID